MKSINMFGGANTPQGFYSCFEDIKSEKNVYIKGGPGTGKSSVMIKAAERAEENGETCICFHCSSDPASLDGIRIVQRNITLFDATPPHNSDPKYPGAGDFIFNTAEFLDSEELSRKKDEVRFFDEQTSKFFKRGYTYLKAALPFAEDSRREYEHATDVAEVDKCADEISEQIFGSNFFKKNGTVKKGFLSSFGPDGVKNYAESVFDGVDTISVKGNFGSSRVISQVSREALKRGFDIIEFYCPLFPSEGPEHILIPEMGKGVTTNNFFHRFEGNTAYDLNDFCRGIPDVSENSSIFTSMLEGAAKCFYQARIAHGILESYYIPSMDFDRLNNATDKVLDYIFG